MTEEQALAQATQEIEDSKPLTKQINNEVFEFTDDDYARKIQDRKNDILNEYNFGYIQKRQEAYPAIGEQLDYIFHHGLDAWKADIIQPIKDQFPKP